METREIPILTQALGAYFLGAVYLGGVMAAAVATHNKTALFLALVSAGFGYFCQVASLIITRMVLVTSSLWIASVLVAIVAGISAIGGL